jgi:hypothetical protein
MARAFLIINALLWVGYGAYLLLAPEALADLAGVTASNATGSVELRTMYGGLQTALGVLALLGALSGGWRMTALAAFIFVYGGMAIGRLIGALIDQEFSAYVIAALIFDSLFAVFAVALRRRESRVSSELRYR